MDDFFLGNIVQRTWTETGGTEFCLHGVTENYVLKENALLYKTKNGAYVDVDSLKNRKDYQIVNKVILDGGYESTKDGILVMPAASLEDSYGIFVDIDSLKPYNDYQNVEDGSKSKRR